MRARKIYLHYLAALGFAITLFTPYFAQAMSPKKKFPRVRPKVQVEFAGYDDMTKSESVEFRCTLPRKYRKRVDQYQMNVIQCGKFEYGNCHNLVSSISSESGRVKIQIDQVYRHVISCQVQSNTGQVTKVRMKRFFVAPPTI